MENLKLKQQVKEAKTEQFIMHNAHDLFRAVCKQLHRERADREGLGRLQSAAAAATDQQLRSTASLPLFPSILLFSALRINAIMSRQLWMKSREKKMKTEDSGQGFSPVEHMQLTLSNDDGKFILLRIMSENHMYTPLYNVEDPNYGSKTTKDYLWVCLAEELNNKGVVCEGKDAKSAFKILIDGLARYHKKRILNGGEVRTYKYEQAMAFLGETPRIIRRSITNSLETMKKIREEEEAQVARHVREMVMVNEGMFPSRNPESFQGRVPQIAQIPPWAQLPSHVLASESEPIGLFGTRQMTLDEPKPTTSTFKESPAKQPRKRKSTEEPEEPQSKATNPMDGHDVNHVCGILQSTFERLENKEPGASKKYLKQIIAICNEANLELFG